MLHLAIYSVAISMFLLYAALSYMAGIALGRLWWDWAGLRCALPSWVWLAPLVGLAAVPFLRRLPTPWRSTAPLRWPGGGRLRAPGVRPTPGPGGRACPVCSGRCAALPGATLHPVPRPARTGALQPAGHRRVRPPRAAGHDPGLRGQLSAGGRHAAGADHPGPRARERRGHPRRDRCRSVEDGQRAALRIWPVHPHHRPPGDAAGAGRLLLPGISRPQGDS